MPTSYFSTCCCVLLLVCWLKNPQTFVCCCHSKGLNWSYFERAQAVSTSSKVLRFILRGRWGQAWGFTKFHKCLEASLNFKATGNSHGNITRSDTNWRFPVFLWLWLRLVILWIMDFFHGIFVTFTSISGSRERLQFIYMYILLTKTFWNLAGSCFSG